MNKKNHEVELRVLLDPEERKSINRYFADNRTEFVSKQMIRDAYYCDKDAKDFGDVEMNEVGSFGLRLREKVIDGKKDIELNIKVITSHGDHHAWEEHETKVDSFAETDEILKALGHKVFFELKKVRSLYKVDNIEIALEDIEDFGSALELEIITTKDDADVAKQTLEKLLNTMGVESHKIVPKSITNILMKQKSRF